MILVALDRDGTINVDVEYLGINPNWKEKIRLHDTVVEAILKLQKTNFKTIVITNQSGVARGYFPESRVKEINDHIDNLLKQNGIKIDGWFYSPYIDPITAQKEGFFTQNNQYLKKTNCRKPRAGMILQAKEKLGEFEKVYVIGDKATDVETGLNAGGSGILVLHGSTKELPKVEELKTKHPDRVFIAENLSNAADIVLLIEKDKSNS